VEFRLTSYRPLHPMTCAVKRSEYNEIIQRVAPSNVWSFWPDLLVSA